MCMGDAPNFACSNTDGSSPSDMISKLKLNSTITPNNHLSEETLKFALTLQRKMFPPLLAAAGAIFAVGMIGFFLLQRDIKEGEQVMRGTSPKALNPRRTERYRKSSTLSFCISTALALASAVSVTQTAAGIQYTSQGITDADLSPTTINIKAGTPSQILHWLILAFLAIFTVSMLSIFDEPFFKTHRNPYLRPEPTQTAGLPGGGGPLPGPVGPPMQMPPPMGMPGPIPMPPPMR